MEDPIPFGALRRLVLRRVLRCRCPQCGAGTLFARYARVRTSCADCGLVFRREQGGQTGSMYLTAAVTQVFAALLIGVVWLTLDLSTMAAVTLCLPPVLLFCFVFLPFSQSLWIGVEYLADAHSAEAWVRPRP